jgi:hypothetical protein
MLTIRHNSIISYLIFVDRRGHVNHQLFGVSQSVSQSGMSQSRRRTHRAALHRVSLKSTHQRTQRHDPSTHQSSRSFQNSIDIQITDNLLLIELKTMLGNFRLLLLSSLVLLGRRIQAFSVLPGHHQRSSSISKQHGRNSQGFPTFAEARNPIDELSEERRANLFQFLLRDLEVEGAPLLGCDADQAHTAQAAVWTVMGQLSERDEGSKACMVLENMPIDSLQTFVDDFATWKADEQMDSLFELKRFNVTLVGRGIGPALILETANRTNVEEQEYNSFISSSPVPNEIMWTAAMKTFVARMELEKEGVLLNPLAYRLSGGNDICDTLATFWTSVCEILSHPEETLGSIVLCLPSVPEDSDSSEAQARFSAVSKLVSQSLFMSRGQDRFELSYMHPLYDRDIMLPKDETVFGHLPPISLLPVMLQETGRQDEAENLTNDQMALQNYQRRSPLPAIAIKRLSQGSTDDGSDKDAYATTALRLAAEGEESLKNALAAEIELTK